jgi:hypothetical protein
MAGSAPRRACRSVPALAVGLGSSSVGRSQVSVFEKHAAIVQEMLNWLGFRSDNNKKDCAGGSSTQSSLVAPGRMDMDGQGNGLPRPTQNEKRFLNPVDPAVAQAIALQAAREQVENGTVVRFFFLL